jgi:hypothetical protein
MKRHRWISSRRSRGTRGTDTLRDLRSEPAYRLTSGHGTERLSWNIRRRAWFIGT